MSAVNLKTMNDKQNNDLFGLTTADGEFFDEKENYFYFDSQKMKVCETKDSSVINDAAIIISCRKTANDAFADGQKIIFDGIKKLCESSKALDRQKEKMK